MGLHQSGQNPGKHRLLHRWALPAALAGISVLIALAGEAGREVLSLYRPAIQQGEVWRLVTAHLAHLGTSHLLLNLAGLLLIWYLVADYLDPPGWLIVTAVSIAGIDLGLLAFESEFLAYLGLSGLLHGLLAAGIVAGLRTGRAGVWVLAVAMAGKIAYEQFAGPLPGSEEASGGPVVVASHAWGALAGAACAAVLIRLPTGTRI